jgi:hypothetical protein
MQQLISEKKQNISKLKFERLKDQLFHFMKQLAIFMPDLKDSAFLWECLQSEVKKISFQ